MSSDFRDCLRSALQHCDGLDRNLDTLRQLLDVDRGWLRDRLDDVGHHCGGPVVVELG
ncbi:MAG: hypothetical protein ACLQLG_03095 [Thermoguttaceae bacterium]